MMFNTNLTSDFQWSLLKINIDWSYYHLSAMPLSFCWSDIDMCKDNNLFIVFIVSLCFHIFLNW